MIRGHVLLGGVARDEAVALIRVPGVTSLFVLVEGLVVAHRHGGANECDGRLSKRLAEGCPGNLAVRLAVAHPNQPQDDEQGPRCRHHVSLAPKSPCASFRPQCAPARYALTLNRLSPSISSMSATFLMISATSGSSIDIFSNLLHHPRELEGILRRVAGLVVVEVAVDVQPLLQPGGECASPSGKSLCSVASPVSVVWSVQPHIREVSGGLLRGGLAIQIVGAKRRLVVS